MPSTSSLSLSRARAWTLSRPPRSSSLACSVPMHTTHHHSVPFRTFSSRIPPSVLFIKTAVYVQTPNTLFQSPILTLAPWITPSPSPLPLILLIHLRVLPLRVYSDLVLCAYALRSSSFNVQSYTPPPPCPFVGSSFTIHRDAS